MIRAMLNQGSPVEDHGSGWSNLWDSGESDLWDRGKASPALVDIVEQEHELLGPFTADGTRKKALVPVRVFVPLLITKSSSFN